MTGNGVFAAVGGKSKQNLKANYRDEDVCPPLKGYTIYYRGDQLSQSDLSIYLRLIKFYSMNKARLGESIWLHLHDFLKADYTTSVPSGAIERLENLILKLYHTEVLVVRPNLPHFYCRLISGRSDVFTGKGNKKMIEISIESTIRDAFNIDGYSFIDLKERELLGDNQLALWLHTYYSRHAKPFPISGVYIHKESKSSAADIIRWVRCTLVPAIEKFKALPGWYLHLDERKGRENAKLHCKKPSTQSQRNFLRKKGEIFD